MLVWVDFNRQLLKCLLSTNDIFHVLYLKSMCYWLYNKLLLITQKSMCYFSKDDSLSIQLLFLTYLFHHKVRNLAHTKSYNSTNRPELTRAHFIDC